MSSLNPAAKREWQSPEEGCKVACEECRKRKLRCDGQQPRCTVCVNTGTVCRVNPRRSARGARGPKKGLLESLRIRTAELQRRLEERRDGLVPYDKPANPENRVDTIDAEEGVSPTAGISLASHVGFLSPEAFLVECRSEGIEIQSDLTRADLNQLYFERVHPFTPFIQKRHFFSWIHQPNIKSSRLCLQLAMWALAASMSAHYQTISSLLYKHARKALEDLELQSTGIGSIDLEQAQSWILLAFYEFMHMHYQRGWMSVGRTCRLIQLMGLHKVDCASTNMASAEVSQPDGTEIEERRRTFWMAYYLDRLVGISNNWPLSFNELVICTRLPTSEAHFEGGEGIFGKFLSEEIAAVSDHNASPFTELIIFVTICGRCLTHKQQAVVELVYGSAPCHFWDRHHWLHSLLAQNLRIISQTAVSSPNIADPMRLFANMMAHTALIYLCNVPNSLPWEINKQRIMPTYEEEALAAALEIANLTRSLDEFGIFKAHPLTPYPVYSAAEFLMQYDPSTLCYKPQLQKLVAVLQSLTPVSNLADHYLQLLRSSPLIS